MWKKKAHLAPWPEDWFYFTDSYRGFYHFHHYFRDPKGRRQWIGQLIIDRIDGRSEGYDCHVRPRTKCYLPDDWEDLNYSIPNPKSWKDVTRKRKQWEK